MNEEFEYQRRVVCAANRDTMTNSIILGARHWDSSMHAAFDLWKRANNYVTRHMRFTEQGFIDQHGVFLSRTEAWKVAKAAGQIIKRCGGDTANGGTLYSENLY